MSFFVHICGTRLIVCVLKKFLVLFPPLYNHILFPPLSPFFRLGSMIFNISLRYVCTAVSEATIAGEPNPCVIRLKCERWCCILGSSIIWGRVLPRGLRSWFNKSISSLSIDLKWKIDNKIKQKFCRKCIIFK